MMRDHLMNEEVVSVAMLGVSQEWMIKMQLCLCWFLLNDWLHLYLGHPMIHVRKAHMNQRPPSDGSGNARTIKGLQSEALQTQKP